MGKPLETPPFSLHEGERGREGKQDEQRLTRRANEVNKTNITCNRGIFNVSSIAGEIVIVELLIATTSSDSRQSYHDVRDMAGSSKDTPLRIKLREASKRQHAVSDALVMARFVGVLADRNTFGGALGCVWFVHDRIQTSLDKAVQSDQSTLHEYCIER